MPLTLTTLPFEMLEVIAAHLDAKRDLCSLCVTCKALHLPSIRQLFHNVEMCFRMSPSHGMVIVNVAPLLQALLTTARPAGANVTADLPRGSLVRTLRIVMDTEDEFLGDEFFDFHDDEYFRASPQHVNRFLRFVTSVLQVCPVLQASSCMAAAST